MDVPRPPALRQPKRSFLVSSALLIFTSAVLPAPAPAAQAPAADAPASPRASDTMKPDAAPIPSPITDRFAIRATFVGGSVTTDGQINDTAGGTTGTPFSLENDFGLSDKAHQVRAEITLRLKNRGHLRVSALDLSRRGSVVLNRAVRYGDQNFLLNDRVNSTFDWRMFDLTWTYSVLKTERFEMATGIGMHFIQTEATAVVPARNARESFDGAGPFVSLAADASWRFTKRFSVNARYQTFDLTISDISARLTDAHADVQFRWKRNLALGVGYQLNDVELKFPNENPGGLMQLKVSGPELFLRASF